MPAFGNPSSSINPPWKSGRVDRSLQPHVGGPIDLPSPEILLPVSEKGLLPQEQLSVGSGPGGGVSGFWEQWILQPALGLWEYRSGVCPFFLSPIHMFCLFVRFPL